MPHGKFIVFEGLDGSGTSTQILMARDRLRKAGIKVETTAEPTKGPLGSVIRLALEKRISLDAQAFALAFAADRADHLRNLVNGMLKTLKMGRWVLCDRYALSSLAYQSMQGLPMRRIAELNRFATDADLTLFIDVDPATAARRVRLRSSHRDLFEDRAKLEKVRQNYRKAIKLRPFAKKIEWIESAGSPDEVFALVWHALAKHFPSLRD